MKSRRPNNPWRLQKMATISVLALIMLNQEITVNGTAVTYCGDAIKNGSEDCDDGNDKSGDGQTFLIQFKFIFRCSSACAIEIEFDCVVNTNPSVCTEKCGDGKNLKTAGVTQCDDSNNVSGDGCSTSCTKEDGWTCSGGSKTTPDVCTQICGDGLNLVNSNQYDTGSACDDKNSIRYDGCFNCIVEDGWYCLPEGPGDLDDATTCYEISMDGKDFGSFACDVVTDSTSGCVAGVIQTGWECSGGSRTAPDTCTEICGDNYHWGSALDSTQCDDGNFVDLDGCSSECVTEDGFYLAGTYTYDVKQAYTEACDHYDYGYLACDCGTTDCSGCYDCAVVAGYSCVPPDSPADGSVCTEICGDSINYDTANYCDDGNTKNNDGCSGTCTVEFGFQCDDTTTTTKDTCTEICGDGYDYKRYQCDDGNLYDYDGCSPTCTVNDGWYCTGGTKTNPDTCYEVCGDGRNYKYWIVGSTACDDGNNDNYDGCDSNCVTEYGYDCTGGDYDSTDLCSEICGDGIKFDLSVSTYCDDGNVNAGDGCNANCLIENGFSCSGGSTTHYDTCYENCGDGRRFTDAGTTTFCDDGNLVAYDGCNTLCGVEDGYYCIGGTASQPDICYEICGDAKNFGHFECDDGDVYDYDGCNSDCLEETGYDCRGGTSTGPDTCYDICGDGTVMLQNVCDDGSMGTIDGCLDDCTIRDGWYCYGGDYDTASACYEKCGDGIHYSYDMSNMQCDDGNNYDYDGCSSTCMLEQGWTCTTNFYPTAGYDTATACAEVCGDSMNFNTLATYCDTGAAHEGCVDCTVVDGWYCGFGGYTTSDTCYEKCGDTKNWGALPCDDLNTYDYDGCTSDCSVEDGWYCLFESTPMEGTFASASTTPTNCYEKCGDGYDFSRFECDDGNSVINDGCNVDCEIEDGFYCTGGTYDSADHCYEVCGDAFDLRLLGCDDGNSVQYDGCYDCAIEDGWYCPGYDVAAVGFTGTKTPVYYPTKCYDTCGDGKLVDSLTYSCDDSNSVSNDGCSNKCQIERGHYCNGGTRTTRDYCYETCGDGYNFPTFTNDCDDANTNSNDGCNNKCQVEDGWYCYGGGPYAQDTCYEICGDQYDHGKFECDDGNNLANDGCNADCVEEAGWDCSGGSSTQGDVDKCYDVCGDGLHMPDGRSNYCDDATSTANDGCINCAIQDGWYCYGGTSLLPDHCYENCGDLYDYGTLGCEDGNTKASDGCSATCTVEPGYTCTGGSASGVDTCYEICGDQYDFGKYACDDGNTSPGDGCSATCTLESGFACTGGSSSGPDTCDSVCGDGLIRKLEVCDDQNTYDGDGCSNECTVEPEYDCTAAEPSVCTEKCGDGKNMGQVECDDQNNADGDGCSALCKVEEGWKCSGGDHSNKDVCTATDFITPSLTDCATFAAKFEQTCTNNVFATPTDFDTMASETHTCQDNYGGLCAGTLDGNGYCAWSRKLCVTCRKDFDTGYVLIRVKTNSLPDHCYYANKYAPIENEIDFEVAFALKNNTINTPVTSITTQADYDALLCSYGWPNKTISTDNLAIMQYSELNTPSANEAVDMFKIVGIALNGVPFFAGTSELGFDVFSPKAYNGQSAKSIPVDLCLGNNDYTRYYHYYSNSPCILTGTQKAAIAGGLCTDDTNCNSNKTKFLITTRTTFKNLQEIGIARDGRKILGPYKADGSVWSACEVDLCNGAYVNNEYVYVTTVFHPYTISCFARGNWPVFTPACSKSPRTCAGESSGVITSITYFFVLAFISFALLLQ
ncbi:lipoprotein [Stylonychia lemnae]|uniref:Lipoprotein n=1 Tax=Stylonychia lemnae TaxID=5949 RepID=A0A078B391_STYLE|nr:lipoprotein [Stylonychia lemnae]|eukprot:CDW87712.1 lipoprotein [Stylonychia lemnae]